MSHIPQDAARRLVDKLGAAAPHPPIAQPDVLQAAAEKARAALSDLLLKRDPIVYSDALRALDEALSQAPIAQPQAAGWRSVETHDQTPAAAPSAPAPTDAEVPTQQEPTLMKLIRAAWVGDRRIAEAYGTLLADRLDADEPGRGRYVRQMLEVLRGERPEVFVHLAAAPAPAVPMPDRQRYLLCGKCWHSEPTKAALNEYPGCPRCTYATFVMEGEPSREAWLAYAAAREALAVERVRGVLSNLWYAEKAMREDQPGASERLDAAWAAARAELGEKT